MNLKVKVKIPNKRPAYIDVVEKLEGAVEDTALQAAKLFEATTATFAKPLTFDVSAGRESATIWTDDENYARLNAGTPAHMIYPGPSGVLAFPDAFGRKTNPGQLYSVAGYRSNNFVFTRQPVMNPGFPARKFDEAVLKKIKPVFLRKVKSALLKGLKG